MSALENPEIFRTIIEGLQTGVYLVDRERKILLWNSGAEQISGYLRHEVIGRSCQDDIVMHSDESGAPLSDSSSLLLATLCDGQPRTAHLYLLHKMGYRIPVSVRVFPIHGDDGKIIGVAESFVEKSIQPGSEEHEKILAAYGCLDEVARVPNRAFTYTHLRESLISFSEHHLPFGVLCLQIDRLGQIKTSHGPEAASAVLRVVARGIRKAVAESDFVGRWGEDLFLVVMTDCGPTELQGTAERIREIVTGAEVRWWGDHLSIAVWFGAAIAEEGDSVDSLTDRAEGLLHAMRKMGEEPSAVPWRGAPLKD